LFRYLHYSESTSQSNHLQHQDSSERDTPDHNVIPAASHNYGETPGTMQTNDVALDTPPSHLERNSASSASSDGSFESISTSEAKSQANVRELDKSGDYVIR
jgi:hypothetical protein